MNFHESMVLTPIHMLYKKRGSISEHFEKLVQPNSYVGPYSNWTSRKWPTVAIWLSWTIMACHGFMDDCQGWRSWKTVMDFTYWSVTDRHTLVLVMTLSRLKMWYWTSILYLVVIKFFSSEANCSSFLSNSRSCLLTYLDIKIFKILFIPYS